MKKTITSLMILLSSCSDDVLPEMKTPDKNALLPKGSTTIGTGRFTSYAHSLAGVATLYSDSLGMNMFSLQHFTMTSGPDVHVYISRSPSYSKGNTIELGKLERQYDGDSLSLDFSHVSYNSDYRFVLVYCLEFNSLFGYAELR